LNITDIRVRRTYQDTRLKALVSVTIDNDLAVHDIKVIEGPERLFVAMPSRKDDNSVFRDICHPITPQARGALEGAILTAYHEYLERAKSEIDTAHIGDGVAQTAVAYGGVSHGYIGPSDVVM